MAVIVKSANAHYDTSTASFAPQISGNMEAGEDLGGAVTPCYIDIDGKVYRCTGAAADKKAVIAGFSNRGVLRGQQVTLYGVGTRFQYGSGLVSGALYYLGAGIGLLDDATSIGGTRPCAQAIDTTDIRIISAY